MKARHKRLIFVLSGLVALGFAAMLVVNALDDNLSYFFSPTEVVKNEAPESHLFRLGGLVETGSVKRMDGVDVEFNITDGMNKVRVVYSGILPDLFEEGKGVITQGRLEANGVFMAEEVLAKHDENYMPPEVAAALEKANKQKLAGENRL